MRHALGAAILSCKNLDAYKRKLLVDILADDMILKYGRSGHLYL